MIRTYQTAGSLNLHCCNQTISSVLSLFFPSILENCNQLKFKISLHYSNFIRTEIIDAKQCKPIVVVVGVFAVCGLHATVIRFT